jgi:hypothetical protein
MGKVIGGVWSINKRNAETANNSFVISQIFLTGWTVSYWVLSLFPAKPPPLTALGEKRRE